MPSRLKSSLFILFVNRILTGLFLVLLTQPVLSQEEATTASGRKVILYANGQWIYRDSLHLAVNHAPYDHRIEIPLLKKDEKVICHTGYCFSYNEKFEQANWVAYELTKEETINDVERSNHFAPDPEVSTGTATDQDYKESGYDRGHLAPAADMEWSPKAMQESFYYSNMSPQVPAFNRGIWKKLEEQVREWAIENEAIYIVTGPVLKSGLPTIGPDEVAIPEYFYKVILDDQEPGIKGIGFILPNQNSTFPLQHFAVPIDSVEKLTGLDFFPALPDDIEKRVEQAVNLEEWLWNSSKKGKNIH